MATCGVALSARRRKRLSRALSKPEVFPQRLAGVAGAERAALLQQRHHPVDELVQAVRRQVRHQDEPVAGVGLDVSVDLVGYFREEVLAVRQQLPGFHYVLVSSTHNHEGPDTLGLWGPNPFKSGVDPQYMKLVRERIVGAVRDAVKSARTVSARLGTATAPELLHDGREPYVKHDEIVAIRFDDVKTKQCAGVVVQWNCHPETLSSKNTRISADYVGYTVRHLRDRWDEDAIALRPDWLSVLIGINDIWRAFQDQPESAVPIDEYERLLTNNEIFLARTRNVGILPPELAIAYSITGPVLRASGVQYDVRRAEPYSIYDRFDFEVLF